VARVSFTGGPLDGQSREMEVYVAVIPVHHFNGVGYAYKPDGHPEAYYVNVNTHMVDQQLRNSGFTHYVFHIGGKRV